MLDKTLNLYLSARKRGMLTSGKGIYGAIATAVQRAGWRLALHDKNDDFAPSGFHMIDNLEPVVPNCLALRRCHLDPFYRIEKTNERWDWEVAHLKFSPTEAKEWFLNYWQKRLFSGQSLTKDGYIFMPLQQHLLGRHHFQSSSPIEMIHATLAADKNREIFATLHPKISYSDAELAALDGIGGRFHLIRQPSQNLLAGCDYVVTQNSVMAFHGYFARKPAVLFAQIDFHHIAGSVPRDGLDRAFAIAQTPRPFASYLHWFLRDHAISAWAEDCPDQITTRLRSHGWPI